MSVKYLSLSLELKDNAQIVLNVNTCLFMLKLYMNYKFSIRYCFVRCEFCLRSSHCYFCISSIHICADSNQIVSF